MVSSWQIDSRVILSYWIQYWKYHALLQFYYKILCRVTAALAHAQVLHQVRTTPGKMMYNVLKMEAIDFSFTVADGLK